MPVIQFTRDVGRKWVEGQVVNLPTSTLKSMARSDKVESYQDFSQVLAMGSSCIKFMIDHKKEQAAESARARSVAVAPKKAAAPRRAIKKGVKKVSKKRASKK